MHSFITFTLATAALTAAVPHARKHYQLHASRDLDSIEPQVVKLAPIAGRSAPETVNLSPIGQCGGSTGFGCAAGQCCSEYGYCGYGPQYCAHGGSHPGHGHAPAHSPAEAGGPAASPAPAVTTSAAPAPSSAAPAPSSYPSGSSGGSGAGFSGYKMYNGNGSPSAGWPDQASWMDFESAFEASKVNMKASCAQWNMENDSDQEIDDIKSAIQSVAQSSQIDERFILAVMMQESNGCVRVQTTDNGVTNPGLMQSHDGAGTCWNDGTGVVPCPAKEIELMIRNGVEGTTAGDGLQQTFQQCPSSGAQAYYQAAVMYNSGNLPSNLDDNTATPCYASDVANRLMGWTSGTSGCTLS